MERIFNILLICIIPISIFSQTYYFNNKYQSNSGAWSGVGSIIETGDGYLIGGTTGSPPAYSWHQITLSILNESGEKIDEKFIGDNFSEYYIASNSLIRTNDDLITFAGTRRTFPQKFAHDEILLIKLNDDYDTLWVKYFGEGEFPFDTAYIARHLIETLDSNLIIVGTMTPESNYQDNVLLIKTDKNGNKLSEWLYTYPNPNYKLRGFSVIATPDKGFAIGAYRFKSGFDYTAEPMVYKVDSLGNEEWHVDIGGSYFDHITKLCNAHDGNIIAATCFADSMSGSDNAYRRINIIKLDLEGNVVWNKKYGNSMLYHYLGNIQQTVDGGYITSGTSATVQFGYPYPYFSGWIFKINSEGDSLWHRFKHNLPYSDDYNYLYDIIPTSDNGFAACGEVFGPATGYTQHAWVIKMDSLGCDTAGCFTTFISEEWLVKEKGKLTVWPNPAKHRVTLRLSKCEVEGLKMIRIYNSQGLKVEEIKVPETKETLSINAKWWPRGFYIVIESLNGLPVAQCKLIIK